MNKSSTQSAFFQLCTGTTRIFTLNGEPVLSIVQDDECDFIVRTASGTHYLGYDSTLDFSDTVTNVVIPSVDGGPSQIRQEDNITRYFREHLDNDNCTRDGLRTATDDELRYAAEFYRGTALYTLIMDYIIIRSR